MKKNIDHFNVLRKIQKNPKFTQRELADTLNISLGKINYCLKALRQKGYIKIKNFNDQKNKLNYVYLLTPKGITEKTRLTINFMKLKMQEYDELNRELNRE
jgi:EPS-associated MarR family transcriptional regulator